MTKRLLALSVATLGAASCTLLSSADRQHPSGPHAFLQEYDGQWLGVLKLKTLFAWLQDNPIETFKEMRAQRPVITTYPVPTSSGPSFTSTVLVAKKQDVVEVLSHPAVFTVR